MHIYDTSVDNLDEQEMLPEDFHVVYEPSPHYMRVDWYAADPDPSKPNFETLEFGPCPKYQEIIDGTVCVRTDFSIISLS